MRIPKELKKILKEARRQGWEVVERKTNHLAWYSPDGESIVHTASSPSDPRSIPNALAALKKAGLKI